MIHNTYQYNRRSIRLKNYDYSKAGYYSVTICTQDRLHLFGEIVDSKMILGVAREDDTCIVVQNHG